jgi:chromosomal replication initiator protein
MDQLSHYQELWKQTKDQMSQSFDELQFEANFGNVKTVVKALNGSIYVLCPDILTKTKMNKIYINRLNEILLSLTDEKVKYKFVTSDEVTSKEPTYTKETNSTLFQSNLRPEYTFDSFISGDSNKLAYRNAMMCAERGALFANPLYIFGGVGLGKTHLMQAMGNLILDDDINKKVLYIESQDFVDEYSKAAKSNKFAEFEEKYNDLDAFLVDDIQMLSNAPKCQEQFFKIFNNMYNNQKLIVIASDRPANMLNNIMDRLTSRFNWGMQVDIEKPDQELRVQILKRKLLESTDQVVPDDVLEFIAKNFTENIRDLEGALRRVLSYGVTFDRDITVDLAKEALMSLLKNSNSQESGDSYDKVMSIVANFYQIDLSDLIGSKRSAKFTTPRHVCMYILKNHYNLPYKKIGYHMGGRDHTTIISAVEKISLQMKQDAEMKMAIDTILKKIG